MTNDPDRAAPAVALEGLEVHVPGAAKGTGPILGPLDLHVDAGEHLVLVGPSGCGKTTLLRAVAGLAEGVRGTVRLFDQLATDAGRVVTRPEDRGLGYLFQGGALWPHMTVAKTLAFTLASGGTPKAERASRSAELLELVDLVGFDDRRPAELSGGEAQRLALARALAQRPRLLLLDEPLGPLDAPRRAALLERIHALQLSQGLTILHVTHDPGEADAYATRTLTLEAGRIAGDERHRDPWTSADPTTA